MDTNTRSPMDTYYDALLSRDARFDGRFFVGVTTTGVYCRPVCRVRAPRKENCRFFPNAPLAEEAGFRPCLRCRPERAPAAALPGGASVESSRLAALAARLLEAGDPLGEEADTGAIAARLGVSDRTLRRVFKEAFGVAPAAYLRTHRLLTAKRLLQETALPVTEVAFASGFGSLRRFNDAFRCRYGMTPSEARVSRSLAVVQEDGAVVLRLDYRPPYDWNALLAFIGPRTVAGVDTVRDGRYLRAVRLDAARDGGACVEGWIAVAHAPPAESSAGGVLLSVSPSLLRRLPEVLGRVRRLFDLDLDPGAVASVLGPLAHGREGLRLPGAFDPFETAVRAVLGQQVSVKAATTLAGRVASAFGPKVRTPFAGVERVFPDAPTLGGRGEGDLAKLGMPASRARTVIALAGAVASGEIELSWAADIDVLRRKLLALPGVGPWTAEYLAMRAAGWPDAFLAADLGVLRALGTRDPKVTAARAEGWKPWRSYATLHLWHSLSEGNKP